MKKLLTILLLTILCLSLVFAGGSEPANPGSIKTTRVDCGDIEVNVNDYARGEQVYIHGISFNAGNYDWKVIGQPGGASCDSETVVAFGNHPVDESGEFCFAAYTVDVDDCGVYKVYFNEKKDGYNVDLKAPIVPEFGAFTGLLTILGALGVFFFVRR